jgi:uncharacterized membrane protein
MKFRPRLALSVMTLAIAASFVPAFAQEKLNDKSNEQFGVAKVMHIVGERHEDSMGIARTVQEVELKIESGIDAGYSWTLENSVIDGREDMRLSVGQRVVIEKQTKMNGESQYLVRETYRLPQIGWLVVFFLAITILFGGLTGIASILGLAVSVALLVLFVVPQIIAGSNPLLVSLVGAVAIACTSLYLAHGFHFRTSVALGSTLLTLVISVVVAIIFVHVARIFGMGTEEAMYLQMGALEHVDLRGLLLGGIIIGSLGVLDDVTTAQTTAIAEIARANPSLSSRELYERGSVIGREHIASLINTLALAYVGASFPLLLLFKTNSNWPFWVTLNSEFLTEEIVRTLVGSSTLLFAVPIATVFAAYAFRGGKNVSGPKGHSHTH